MTYEEWGKRSEISVWPETHNMYADWTEDRKQLKARIKQLEAFTAPIRRAYEGDDITANTVDEVYLGDGPDPEVVRREE